MEFQRKKAYDNSKIMDSHSILLTEEAKIAKIKSLLPMSNRRGKFFIPDDAFYALPCDDAGLKAQLKQLSLWVGFKPIGLKLTFDDLLTSDSVFNVRSSHPEILLHGRFRNNAYACGGLVAEGLMRYYLEFRKKTVLADSNEQQVFIDLAVIYGGLGLVALNKSTSIWQQKYPRLYASVISKVRAPINNYPLLTRRFAKENGLELRALARYLCPWALAVLNLPPSINPVTYAKTAAQKVYTSYTALVIIIMVISCGIALGTYITSQRPVNLSAEQRQEKETIDILRKSHELCLDSVARKQKAYDENDFFITRSINADRLRCTSIQNLYNSHVEHYNSQL